MKECFSEIVICKQFQGFRSLLRQEIITQLLSPKIAPQPCHALALSDLHLWFPNPALQPVDFFQKMSFREGLLSITVLEDPDVRDGFASLKIH